MGWIVDVQLFDFTRSLHKARWKQSWKAVCIHILPSWRRLLSGMVRSVVSLVRGSKHLWNVGQFVSEYMTQHPRRRHLHARSHESLKYDLNVLFQETTKLTSIRTAVIVLHEIVLG
jgi:hypothetical protein